MHEHGNWKPVSGAAEPGASVIETAVRELGEEVNVEVGPGGDLITTLLQFQIASCRLTLLATPRAI